MSCDRNSSNVITSLPDNELASSSALLSPFNTAQNRVISAPLSMPLPFTGVSRIFALCQVEPGKKKVGFLVSWYGSSWLRELVHWFSPSCTFLRRSNILRLRRPELCHAAFHEEPQALWYLLLNAIMLEPDAEMVANLQNYGPLPLVRGQCKNERQLHTHHPGGS